MAGWVLVPCLVTLRNEFNKLSPGRDHASDGSIGDAAHQANESDHNPDETGATPTEDSDHINEVHAIDVDNTGPWPDGWTFGMFMEILRLRAYLGLDNRITLLIWNRRKSSTASGWKWVDYHGASPHTEHGHISVSYVSSRESNTAPFGLLEEVVLDTDKRDIVRETVAAVLAGLDDAPIRPNRTLGGSIDALCVVSGTEGANGKPRKNPVRIELELFFASDDGKALIRAAILP